MDFMDNSDSPYIPSTSHKSDDVVQFVESLSELDDDVVIGWRNNRTRTAHPGIWMRRGNYKLKHGSFVDPTDLSCYAAQFYVADDSGRHDCLQIGHGLEGPEDCIAIETLGQFREALTPYLPAKDGDAETDSSEAVDTCTSDTPSSDSSQSKSPSEIKLLQPDGAFELHGSLTRGWSAVEYTQQVEEGIQNVILVFD